MAEEKLICLRALECEALNYCPHARPHDAIVRCDGLTCLYGHKCEIAGITKCEKENEIEKL